MSAALFFRAFFWLWFAGAVAVGQWLVLPRRPPVAIPLLILALAGLLVTAFLHLRTVRGWLEAVDLRTLVLLHVSRLIGVYFLFLHQRGELPRAFAVTAGAGEIVVAVMALPVALAPLEDALRRRAIRIWSIVGAITMLLAVFTMLRLNLSAPWQLHALTRLPLSLYPTFFMPLLLAAQLVVLIRSTSDDAGT